jgi:hypothetical protein
MLATLLVAGCGGVLEPTDPDESDAAAVEVDADLTPAPDAAPGTPDAAAAESLSVAFDTTPNGGPYAPDNVVVVWIEGPGGVIEKTIGRWAANRAQHLVAWVAASGLDTDAVSGATRPNHTARLTVQWDLTDRNGQVIPDGTYTIRMELADQNSNTAAQNHQGTFTFDKNGTAATQAVAGGGFLNVSIDYSGR